MTFEEFANEMRPFHNHIVVVYDMELARLVGVHDGKDDYYYIFKSTNSPRRNGNTWYGTAVGWIVSLKDIYPQDRYEVMDRNFEMNGATAEQEFLLTKDEEPK